MPIGTARSAPRRGPALLFGALLALTLTLLGAAPAQAAGTGKINSWGDPVNVRSGPGTGYSVVGSLAHGTTVTIQCTARGTNVEGPYGWTDLWDNIGNNRWVADALVDTGTMNPVAGACGGSGGLDPGRYPWPATDGWVADGAGYYAGECTSFAAWAVRNDNIASRSPDWRGNADMWDDDRGTVSVVSTPRVGDVAQWDPYRNEAGSAGHVAYVSAVNGDGTVQIQEYNWGTFHRYNTRRIAVGNPSRYLRF
ncbi:CHAP domain-containing protein [Micromonospora sp. NPDC049559]|uniref:CHAP domain-containing protein n=1 Tax=Micromonospora sp. NPDC049559 TaxID=3155923 RepID=UPI0034349A99